MRLSIPMSILLSILFVAASAPAFGKGAKDEDEMREKIREKIRAHRAARLIDVLALDEKTATKFFPVLNKYDDQILPLQADTGKARRELKQMLSSGTKADDTKVNALVDRMLANHDKVAKLRGDRLKDVRKLLSPVQFAKLVVVLPEIDHAIQKQIQKALKKGGRGGKGRAFDDDDDERE